MKFLATIGYESATVQTFLDALRDARIDLLVDVRAAARSRRPGFAKSRLAATLQEAGIAYLHLSGLGTPADGRAAARAGNHEEMKRVFREHLASAVAQEQLSTLVDLIGAGQRVCLLCLENDPEHCHRSIVARAAAARIPLKIDHLHPME
ncbi:DUF488 domain-containing protein [soil metagenome]